MAQFIYGLLAGVVVGLVMEWVIDWTGLVPKRSALNRASPKTGQKSSVSNVKRGDKDASVQVTAAPSSSNPEISGK